MVKFIEKTHYLWTGLEAFGTSALKCCQADWMCTHSWRNLFLWINIGVRLLHVPGFGTPGIPGKSWALGATVTVPNLPISCRPRFVWIFFVLGHSSWGTLAFISSSNTNKTSSNSNSSTFPTSQGPQFLFEQLNETKTIPGIYWDYWERGKTPNRQRWWAEHPRNSGCVRKGRSSSNCRRNYRKLQDCSRARHGAPWRGGLCQHSPAHGMELQPLQRSPEISHSCSNPDLRFLQPSPEWPQGWLVMLQQPGQLRDAAGLRHSLGCRTSATGWAHFHSEVEECSSWDKRFHSSCWALWVSVPLCAGALPLISSTSCTPKASRGD